MEDECEHGHHADAEEAFFRGSAAAALASIEADLGVGSVGASATTAMVGANAYASFLSAYDSHPEQQAGRQAKTTGERARVVAGGGGFSRARRSGFGLTVQCSQT